MPYGTDFLPFATAVNANVTSQTDYAAESTTASGFESGVADSADCNKVWRQATVMVAALANYISNELGIYVYDNGNLSQLITNLTAALQAPATVAQNNAEAFATTKANTAQTNAEAYAAVVASSAQSNAESYAGSAAELAQTNAESYASTVAETQAAAAQNNAVSISEAYTNNAQANAIATAENYTDRAQTSAETYAASVANAAQTNAETYTDTALENYTPLADFANNGTANPGFIKLPNGLYLQWGTTGSIGSGITQTFPHAMSTVRSLVVTATGDNVQGTYSAQVTSTTTFIIYCQQISAYSWFAIGF